MMIIGCDFHPSWQQVSWVDTETGDCGEAKLVHASGDAQQFYGLVAHSSRFSASADVENRSSQRRNNSVKNLSLYPHNEHRVVWATLGPRS